MDRFIDEIVEFAKNVKINLKSNMDRFIENTVEYQLMFAKI